MPAPKPAAAKGGAATKGFKAAFSNAHSLTPLDAPKIIFMTFGRIHQSSRAETRALYRERRVVLMAPVIRRFMSSLSDSVLSSLQTWLAVIAAVATFVTGVGLVLVRKEISARQAAREADKERRIVSASVNLVGRAFWNIHGGNQGPVDYTSIEDGNQGFVRLSKGPKCLIEIRSTRVIAKSRTREAFDLRIDGDTNQSGSAIQTNVAELRDADTIQAFVPFAPNGTRVEAELDLVINGGGVRLRRKLPATTVRDGAAIWNVPGLHENDTHYDLRR